MKVRHQNSVAASESWISACATLSVAEAQEPSQKIGPAYVSRQVLSQTRSQAKGERNACAKPSLFKSHELVAESKG